ncbi:hypothetical protein [Paenibacillus sedimenti]|nr:hypothetical protein [Paenibacillus sedimenti]
MMGIDREKQNQVLFVNLDDLVPRDHVLRLIRSRVDFTFIY